MLLKHNSKVNTAQNAIALNASESTKPNIFKLESIIYLRTKVDKINLIVDLENISKELNDNKKSAENYANISTIGFLVRDYDYYWIYGSRLFPSSTSFEKKLSRIGDYFADMPKRHLTFSENKAISKHQSKLADKLEKVMNRSLEELLENLDQNELIQLEEARKNPRDNELSGFIELEYEDMKNFRFHWISVN